LCPYGTLRRLDVLVNVAAAVDRREEAARQLDRLGEMRLEQPRAAFEQMPAPRPRRSEAVAAGHHLRERRHGCDDSSQGGCARKNLLVHGAGTAQLALAAGVLDELALHLIPVLVGQGRRLFEGLAPEQIELERTRTLEGEADVTHMHYRVRR
jgi:riboflavin biosynthesis pyrimidine reductase